MDTARRVSISERCKDSQKSFRIEHRLTRLLTHVMTYDSLQLTRPTSPHDKSTSRHDRSSYSRHDKTLSTIQYPEDENVERGNWSGRFDFILSLLGYAVGLGNVWRFPYLCYRNGGGAFLIPYAVMLVFVGIPLFYMELALGQYSSSGPLTCWDFAPIFKGIGIAQLMVNSLVGIYYNMIIAWSLFYLVASFVHASNLPWSNCNNEWNTDMCFDKLPDVPCNTSRLIQYPNGTCYNSTGELIGLWNPQLFNNVTGFKRTSASEEYYDRRVLRLSSGIDVVGPVMWDLALSLVLAWVISFLCMIKGIKTTGKVVYVTAIFPYVVLFILFGRGVSLPNAKEGILFYLKPDFSRLADAGVWNDAALQIFFSMSNCWGGLIALASYNKFHNNFERDTVIVTLANFFTGIFAGFVVFGFLGFMAGAMEMSIEEVIESGPGLAFVVYPDAVARMPVSALWAILFFLMLLTLGLDSEFAGLEAILTSLLDQFIFLRPYKTWVIFTMCVFFFLLGLPLCTTSGNYWLQLMDSYCSGWGLLTIALLESIAVGWVYGCARFYEDIRIMIGYRPSIWWRINLQFITPAFIVFLLIFNWADYQPSRYGDYIYPTWADVIGWFMSFFVVVWIPVYAIYLLCKEHDGGLLKMRNVVDFHPAKNLTPNIFVNTWYRWPIANPLSGPPAILSSPGCLMSVQQRLRNLTLPTVYWGPAVVKHRMLVNYVDGFEVDPWATDGLLPSATESTILDFRPPPSGMNGQATSTSNKDLKTSVIMNGSRRPSSSDLLADQSDSKPSFSFESAV